MSRVLASDGEIEPAEARRFLETIGEAYRAEACARPLGSRGRRGPLTAGAPCSMQSLRPRRGDLAPQIERSATSYQIADDAATSPRSGKAP